MVSNDYNTDSGRDGGYSYLRVFGIQDTLLAAPAGDYILRMEYRVRPTGWTAYPRLLIKVFR